jgi:hypothetical protein
MSESPVVSAFVQEHRECVDLAVVTGARDPGPVFAIEPHVANAAGSALDTGLHEYPSSAAHSTIQRDHSPWRLRADVCCAVVVIGSNKT